MALFKKISTTAEEVKTGEDKNDTPLYRCAVCGEETLVVEYDSKINGFVCEGCKRTCDE